MKDKFKKFISMFVMLFMVVTLVAGCGDKEITSLTVKEGTLEYVYMQNSDVSDAFDEIKVVVKYNDDSKEEVGKDKLTISEFKSDVVGSFKVTIKYGDKSTEVTLRVTNDPDEAYDIMGVENPESIVLRENNIAEKANKEVEFYEREDIYVVGDDNPFVFFPKIQALNENDEMIVINSYRSVSTLYVKTAANGDYTLVEDAQVSTYVEIDDRASTYDFVDGEATGKYFKLVVRPYHLTEEQLLPENIGDYTAQIEFKVVDGYNVTDEKQLVVMTNYSHDGDRQLVEDADRFLTTNGIVRPSTPIKGIVLHNDLTIEKEDLPAEYFETIDGETYLDDYIDLYSHRSETGDEFTLHGNYYTIDFSKMPKAKHDNGETSHTTAFRITSPVGVDAFTINTARSYLRNVSFVGNANRSADESKTAGISGLILLKAENHKVSVENCLMRTFFMHLMTDNWSKTLMDVYKVKSYDSYQNSIFAWGGTIYIRESELKRAGGPLMILQHPHLDEAEYNDRIDSYAPELFVDENTVLESYVTGNEPWFVTMGASKTVTFLNALARTFEGKDKTYVKEVQDAEGNSINAMNLISVLMSSGYSIESVTAGSSKAKGFVKLGVEFDANGNPVANTGEDIINKYPDGMNSVKAGIAQVPLVQMMINQGVLEGMLETPEVQQLIAALNAGGANITDATSLAMFIEANKDVTLEENQFKFQLVAIYKMLLEDPTVIAAAVDTIMEAAPVFKSTEGGFGFVFTTEDTSNMDSLTPEQMNALLNSFSLQSTVEHLFEGDYVGMYYLGMGITLGYYDTATN